MNLLDLLPGGVVGRLLDLENVESISSLRLSFTEDWAGSSGFWAWLAAAVAAAIGVASYRRLEPAGRRHWPLAAARAAALAALVLLLAGPALTVTFSNSPRPLVYLLFDATSSMAIRDQLADDQQQRLLAAVGMSPAAAAQEPPARIDYVRSLIRKDEANPLRELAGKARLRAFVFDRRDGVRAAGGPAADGTLDWNALADELAPEGDVTALGTALGDLAARHRLGNLAGVVAFGDFGWNSGPSPIGSETSPVARLGVPVFTVGVGPEAALDLRTELSAAGTVKKGERMAVTVRLAQSQLDGRSAEVEVTALRRGADGGAEETITVGRRQVLLDAPETSLDFSFEPDASGRYELAASVAPLDGEQVTENNRASRDLTVTDDFLRLLFVANEPTWEWRFVKEVFHRDRLVGLRGFRTFLRSSDPSVRRDNPLFVPALEMSRAEFFATDVLFLGDMPRVALSPEFCERVREYVDTFAGGLVVMAGADQGLGQLADTPLADLLPVTVEATATPRVGEPFRPRLTPAANGYDFMQLGGTPEENAAAWENLGELPWYQPVVKRHFQAEVLAEHPTDRMADGQPQPLVAVRPYGRGQVVYIAFDEMWRLRRRFGETYYRQFWGQLIHRLGLGHAIGSQKRFVVRTRSRYAEGDEVRVTVEAYDENFQPLTTSRGLEATVQPPLGGPQPLSLPLARPGVFEAPVPLSGGGAYRIAVKDPLTGAESVAEFTVAARSAELQSVVRNVPLQRQIAEQSGGRAYDLADVARLPAELDLAPRIETGSRTVPLLASWWATLACLAVLVTLLCGEWIGRKMTRLP